MNLADKEALLLQLQSGAEMPMVTVDGWPSATLVYGYDVERYTFHVYKHGGMLHRVIYRRSLDGTVTVVQHEKSKSFPAERMTPSKATYWQHSDYGFLSHVARLGAYVHLKDSVTEHKSPYHGHVAGN